MNLISSKTVKCRKVHQCVYCEQKIAPKENAVRHVYRDGGICVSYAHEDCQKATEWARWKIEDYECAPDGQHFIEYELASYLASKEKSCQD